MEKKWNMYRWHEFVVMSFMLFIKFFRPKTCVWFSCVCDSWWRQCGIETFRWENRLKYIKRIDSMTINEIQTCDWVESLKSMCSNVTESECQSLIYDVAVLKKNYFICDGYRVTRRPYTRQTIKHFFFALIWLCKSSQVNRSSKW